MAGLYILLDPVSTFIKIGRASDLETRLANLRTANPWLQLLQWFETPHGALVESYVHARLVAYRREGEFFAVPAETAAQEVADILALLATKPDKAQVEEARKLEVLLEPRDPSDTELALMQQIVDLRAKIKTCEVQDQILSEKLMVSLGQSKGLTGWASFNGSQTVRFDASQLQQDHPDLAQDYLKTTYSRTLKIRPGMA